MLRTLYIENIAVIEKTSIDFENGLNVLTGETGAGKSIIIDAINAIMGQRTSKEIIRTEADSAFVSAQFDDINQSIVEKLDELGFSDDEGTLILQRTFNRNGKSSCKINGKPATVSMLKELSKHLINIHGQHESYELFSPETHIDYIDRFGGCEKLLTDYKKCYDEYKILKMKLNSADSDESERLKEIDLLSYQVNELTESDVKQGEEQELESERTALMSFEKIFSLLNDAKHTEVLKHAIKSAHNYSMHILLMNKKKWDSLTPEQQQIITEAAKEATVWQRAESVKLEKKAWDAFKAKGIEITMLTPEQRKELYDKTAPVREQFAKEIPAELLQLIADTQK